MNRNVMVLVLGLVMAFSCMAYSQELPCEVIVSSPQEGDIWQAGTTYSLEWTLTGWDCMYIYPQQFYAIELIGLSPSGEEMIMDTLTGVSMTGPLDYTPTASIAGYSAYFFRFWLDFGGVPRTPFMAGNSPVFQIQGDSTPTLVASPSALSFILPAGTGTASSMVYVTSNHGAIRWTAAGSHSWLTANPAQATSTEGAASTPVTVTVGAAGLPPGRYPATMTFTESNGSGEAVVDVTLTIIDSGGGTAALAVAPDQIIFTRRVGTSIPSQEVALSNTGGERTPWVAEVNAGWLTVSPMDGYLAGGATTAVTFSINEQFLLPGSYRTYVHFRGADGKDHAVQVDLNLIQQAGPGTWPPAGMARLTLPVASHTPGAEGSFWLTDATALITDGTAQAAHARYKIRALRSLPEAVSLLGQSRLDALLADLEQQAHAAPPRGTTQFIWGALGGKKARTTEAVITETILPDDRPTLFLDIMGQYFGLTNTFGFLQMAGSRANDVLLVSRTYTTATDDGAGKRTEEESSETYGQSVQAPTDPEIIGPEGGIAYVPGLRYEPVTETTKGWRSNLFVTEIGGVATSVSVQLYDAHGTPVGTAQTKTLEPFTQWPLVNTATVFGTTLPWTYAAVTSAGGGRIVVLGSVVDSNSNDPTTINGLVAAPAGRAAEDIILPAVVRTPGNYGTHWRSDITLLNASDSTLTVKAQFIPMTGTAAGIQEAWISLEPRGMGVYLDIVSTLFDRETGTGTIRLVQVDPGTFFAFNRIYNIASDGATYGQGTSAYRASDTVGMNDGTLYAVGLERSPQYRTNVGVVEIAGAPATVLFTVVAPSGESRAYLAKLVPGQWVQADDIIRDKVGFAEDFANAWVMINVVEGAGRVVGYASITDNRSGDATYIKLEKR